MFRTISAMIVAAGLTAGAGAGPATAQTPTVLWAEPAVGDAAGALDSTKAPATQPTTQPARPNPLPGITLDKQSRRVMVDCVALRAGGPLELVACIPNSREHEAIVTAQARPQHIHLALLLCGFEPGHPAGWDEKTEKLIMPTGDPLDIQFQWIDPKTQKVKTVPVEDWLAAADPAKPVPRLTWLFTGSQRFEDGSYWADVDGSVISISNFPDALIDLTGAHTRDNQSLEFKSNDAAMPPAGTKCVMILLPPAAMPVELDRFGKLTVWGRPVPPNRLPDMLAAHKRAREDARLELTVAADALQADIDKLTGQCAKAGFAADRIQRRTPTTQEGAFVFPTNDPQAAIDLLTGQWRQQRETVLRAVGDQRQWFGQLEGRRQLLARQYEGLSDYVSQARVHYRKAVADQRPD